jgi:hypothetical protein
MFARLKCFFFGHKRGKRILATTIQCPRCLATWERKPHKKAEAA